MTFLLRIIQEFISAFIVAVILLMFCVSDAVLIFSGDLKPFLMSGIGILIVSTAAISLTLSLFSSFERSVGAAQDTSVIILAVIGVSLSAKLLEVGNSDALLPTFITTVLLSSIASGAILFIIGFFKLGNFVRFIPYPVLGGFIAGTGILIVLASWTVITDTPFQIGQMGEYFALDQFKVWFPAIFLGLILFTITRLIKESLVLPVTILLAIGGFYLYLFYFGISIDKAQTTGIMIGPFPEGSFWSIPDFFSYSKVDWNLLWGEIGNILALIVLTPLSLLLNATGIESVNRTDMNLNKELKVSGISNIFSPFIGGGVVGYHSIFATEISRELGSRTRIAGVVIALVSLVALFYGIHIISLIPKSVVGAIIFYLGFELAVRWLYDASASYSKVEYFVILLITVTIVKWGFLEGLLLGTLVSLVVFVVNYSGMGVIKQVLAGSYFHSNVERGTEERTFLSNEGDQILVVFLQGFLFFGNANDFYNRVMSKIHPVDSKVKYLIIDFKEVSGLDSSSIHSFVKLYHNSKVHDVRLVFTAVTQKSSEMLKRSLPLNSKSHHVKLFSDIDHGLEWCEECLLEKGLQKEKAEFNLERYLKNLFQSSDKAKELIKQFEKIELQAGTTLFQQGETSDDMYFLDSGCVEVVLEGKDGSQVRLRTIGPGTVIGEIGMYLRVSRGASIVAQGKCILYRIDKKKLDQLHINNPRLALDIDHVIISQLSSRLLYANQQIQGLLNPTKQENF